MIRRGFTLIEIMVSIMIFTVVALAMMTIMLMASEIYRSGEAGRSANDETVAVMAALDEDLARIVPAADGGWFYASMDGDDDGAADSDGDTLIAFKIARRDRSQIDRNGVGDRAIVAWWVRHEVMANNVTQSVLYRGEAPADLLDDDPATDQDLDTFDRIMTTTALRAQVTTGCLHFGAYLAADAGGRDLGSEWLDEATGGQTLPNHGEPTLNTTGQPLTFPAAVRITAVLSGGGRFAPRGRLIGPLTTGATSFRIAGIPGLATRPGSMLRITDPVDPKVGEWIGYDGYSGGLVTCTNPTDPLVGRGRRRSLPGAFPTQSEVRIGQSFSLVRTLPH